MLHHRHQAQGGRPTEFPQACTTFIQAMMRCFSVCTACAKRCTEEGHKKAAQLCLECADLCALAIKSTSCQSDFNARILELCAYACSCCAEECACLPSRHCQECADACRQCADACRRCIDACAPCADVCQKSDEEAFAAL